ncbi:DNA cytosine methyltransferase [Parasphingopyxis sp. CP4]|nr:DNA cytosine methyltransferase [Parasphingopyxis sp. CP4]
MDVVDFFCGCGGTSAGLREAGMSIVAGIDFDPEAGRTFERNFPEACFFEADIQTFQYYDLVPLLPRDRTVPLMFAACAPCQPFTKQNTAKKVRDKRKNLLDELHRFVRAFRPEYILVENVPGLQKVRKDQGALGRFLKLLRSLSYRIDVQILRSQDYGVPQSRRRLVMVASLMGEITIPEPTHGPGRDCPEYEKVWTWIGDLPPIAAGEKHPDIPNHVAANLSDLNLKRIDATPEGGGRLDWPEDLKLRCHQNHGGHTDVYGRLHKDRPAAAMTTRCISLSNGRFGHPTQARAISVREAARLQTFDDDFIFCGTPNETAQQIGNAVPVRLAKVLGDTCMQHSTERLG